MVRTWFQFWAAPDGSVLLKDDVLKARLKTVGVSEYKFEMEVTAGRDSGTEWRIVDVGGSRSQVRLEFCFIFTEYTLTLHSDVSFQSNFNLAHY